MDINKNKVVEKIGDVNFKDFNTEFFLTKKVKDYLEERSISIAVLLQEGWLWYEATLFDLIDNDEDGIPEEEFGKNFKVIYNGIIEKRDFKNNKLKDGGFMEEVKYNKKYFITSGFTKVNSLNKNEFLVKYLLLMNKN